MYGEKNIKYAHYQKKFEPSYDPNYIVHKSRHIPIKDPLVQTNGSTRITTMNNFGNPYSINYSGGMMYTKDDYGQKIKRPNNTFPMYFYTDPIETRNVYAWYENQDLPNSSWQPRSQANGGEYYKSIQNEQFYRKETEYELANNIIHPTHFNEITPERLAHDPNQVIYNYHKSHLDTDDKAVANAFVWSRRRNNYRRNKRKTETQIITAINDDLGDLEDDRTDLLYW